MTEPHGSPAQTIAVVGATGQQGGSAARALLADGIRVKALVRSTESEAARALRDLGADLVVAHLEDPESLRAAFSDTDGLFAMTTNWGENGVEGEVRHGLAIADAAAAVNVPRVVYSSVGGAERHTGIPHFESKRRVEEYMLERLNVRFVRPTFFMDNLAAATSPTDDDTVVFRLPLPADTPLQMIAVTDIGVVAAALLTDASKSDTQGVEIAGDELTGTDIAALLGEYHGKPARFESLPLEVLGDDEERRTMFAWFADAPSYRADFAATKVLDPDVLTLAQWLEQRK